MAGVMTDLHVAAKLAARTVGRRLRSEAAMTFLDGILASATLVGLALNAVAGWWWADPAAALVVAVAAANEARENWEEAAEIGAAAWEDAVSPGG